MDVRYKDLYFKAVQDGKLLSGVIGLESAGYYHGLNMYGMTPLILMSSTKKRIGSPYIVQVPFVSDLKEGIEHIDGKLYVTSRERTVCELVIADGNEEFIYMTLDGYLDKGSKNKLMEYAIKYNCVEQMKMRIETLGEYMDEFYRM